MYDVKAFLAISSLINPLESPKRFETGKRETLPSGVLRVSTSPVSGQLCLTVFAYGELGSAQLLEGVRSRRELNSCLVRAVPRFIFRPRLAWFPNSKPRRNQQRQSYSKWPPQKKRTTVNLYLFIKLNI